MKIVADGAIPFLDGVLDKYAEVVRLEGSRIGPRDVKDADALLIRTRTKCGAGLLEGSRVRFIGSATIGYDHIDTEYCRDNGISVHTAQGCNAMAVTHYIASVIQYLNADNIIGDPGKTTLGIIGAGNIGSKVEKLGKLLGFEVLTNDPPRAALERGFNNTELNELLSRSDIVTMHVPYTVTGEWSTANMADEAFFSSMKREGVFINTSRGEAVCEKALKEHGPKHIFLDVWRNEPRIDNGLLRITDIGTPHIAGYTVQGKANGTASVINALAEHFGIEELAGWYPQGIKKAGYIPKDGKEILNLAAKNYDIRKDDATLRQSPETFEQQRIKYNYREEYFTL